MLLGTLVLLATFQSPGADSIIYVLSPESRLEVHTGKAGLFGFAGHEHVIRAGAFSGTIVYHPNAPERSHLEIVIPAESLEVLTPPDTAEIRKVTATMRTEVLDVAHYPRILFTARLTQRDAGHMHLVGTLTIRDRSREVPVDGQVEIDRDTLRATATFAVKQTDFGIKPYRGGPGGTVAVADRVTFDIRIIAHPKT